MMSRFSNSISSSYSNSLIGFLLAFIILGLTACGAKNTSQETGFNKQSSQDLSVSSSVDDDITSWFIPIANEYLQDDGLPVNPDPIDPDPIDPAPACSEEIRSYGGTLTEQSHVDSYRCTVEIVGSLTISPEEPLNLEPLAKVRSISRSLYITGNGMDNLTGFDSLERIGIDFLIYDTTNLVSIGDFPMLSRIGGASRSISIGGVYDGSLKFYNNNVLKNTGSFPSLTWVSDSFEVYDNQALLEVTGFSALERVGELHPYIADSTPDNFSIFDNPSLLKIQGFPNLTDVYTNFEIQNNTDLITVSGFTSLVTVGRDFLISHNPLLETIRGFQSLEIVGYEEISQWIFEFTGKFEISNNASLKNLGDFSSIAKVGGFYIHDNYSLSHIGGFIELDSIVNGYTEYDFVIVNNFSLVTIGDFPKLSFTHADFDISNNSSLVSIGNFPVFTQVNYCICNRSGYFRISAHPVLETIGDFSSLTVVINHFEISDNPQLMTSTAFPELLEVGPVPFRRDIEFIIGNNGIPISVAGQLY